MRGGRAISDILLVASGLMPDGQLGWFYLKEWSDFLTHNSRHLGQLKQIGGCS